ncbi:MAG: glycosyltransferase family 2 protein [Mobilitalea sp.]
MNILSVIVPCFNSEKYMSKCLDSLLEESDDIEILIINDGSTDNTKQIADDYLLKYPSIIKVIHQENLGHGGAINTGIEIASSEYIKVVDSDDWVDSHAFRRVVKTLKSFVESSQKIDMIVSDFVYDKVGFVNKKIMHYVGIIPTNTVIKWDDIGRFKMNKYILMHSVIYRLEILKECELRLPNHTFYVDNLYVFLPLKNVKSLYYINECVYHYYIGRDNQSVNEQVMIERIDQQILINQIMFEDVNFRLVNERNKRRYIFNYLLLITIVSSVLLVKSGSDEALFKKKVLWKSIRRKNFWLYLRMRTQLLGLVVNLPGIIGKSIILFTYRKAQKYIGFN